MSGGPGGGGAGEGGGGLLRVAAFKNWDGEGGWSWGPMVVVVINSAASAASVQLQVSGLYTGAVEAFVTIHEELLVWRCTVADLQACTD